MADLFLQRNAVREATAFLLDVLQDNKPENDKLQTKVQILSTPPNRQEMMMWLLLASVTELDDPC